MKVITIGKKLVPVEQVAFVEPFDPTANPEFKPEKDYKGRIVMLNRDIVLTEQTPQEFAAEHELHLFTEDSVAVNRAIVFRVETFEPTESLPAKPYKTRLKWRDLTGGEQSKLFLTEAETVIAEILGVKAELAKAANDRGGGLATADPPASPANEFDRASVRDGVLQLTIKLASREVLDIGGYLVLRSRKVSA